MLSLDVLPELGVMFICVVLPCVANVALLILWNWTDTVGVILMVMRLNLITASMKMYLWNVLCLWEYDCVCGKQMYTYSYGQTMNFACKGMKLSVQGKLVTLYLLGWYVSLFCRAVTPESVVLSWVSKLVTKFLKDIKLVTSLWVVFSMHTHIYTHTTHAHTHSHTHTHTHTHTCTHTLTHAHTHTHTHIHTQHMHTHTHTHTHTPQSYLGYLHYLHSLEPLFHVDFADSFRKV